MKRSEIVIDCVNTFCWCFTFGVIASWFLHDDVKVDTSFFISAAFTFGRLLSLLTKAENKVPSNV
ncbi:hypothetical protein DXH95_06090 [Sphingorhabdus pulchriflava]|uniref:Uncharacterized protein n=1 Tax=Sphingorhabdus pulchriflava TaxID=2292257 RepID=A0A371BH87_9SPHN|nr:hypothetical protein DXH95_06090 [Sphingorhabdus pulchriflava]